MLQFLDRTVTGVEVLGQPWDEQINFSDDRMEKFMDKPIEIHVRRLYRLISYCADLKIKMYGHLLLDEKKRTICLCRLPHSTVSQRKKMGLGIERCPHLC